MAASYGCSVIAIEPQADLLRVFNASINLNRFENLITVLDVAIARNRSERELVNCYSTCGSHRALVGTKEIGGESDSCQHFGIVKAFPLDDLVQADVLLLKVTFFLLIEMHDLPTD